MPPFSCQIPVIPVESSGVKFGRKACENFHSSTFPSWKNLGIPELRPEWSLDWQECHQSLVVCLAMAFTPDTKYTDKHSLLFHHHQPSSLLPPPFLTAASHPDHPPWAKQHVGRPVDCHIMCCRLNNDSNATMACHITTLAMTIMTDIGPHQQCQPPTMLPTHPNNND